MAGDELEPAGGLERIAGPIVQVAEHVPLAQVVVADPLGDLGRPAHRAQRTLEVTPIGLGAGRHDAGLGEHVLGG